MLDSKAAVAAIGSLKKLPSYSDIEIGLLDKDVRFFYSFFHSYYHLNKILFAGFSTLQEKVSVVQIAEDNFQISDILIINTSHQSELLLQIILILSSLM